MNDVITISKSDLQETLRKYVDGKTKINSISDSHEQIVNKAVTREAAEDIIKVVMNYLENPRRK